MEKNMEITEEVNAAKYTVSGEGVWGLVSGAASIVVASGRKVVQFDPAVDDKNEILAKISGRTGNLRAPTLRIGKTYYVGFNESLYEQLTLL